MNKIPYHQIRSMMDKLMDMDKIPSKPETSPEETSVQNDRCTEIECQVVVLHWIYLVYMKFKKNFKQKLFAQILEKDEISLDITHWIMDQQMNSFPITGHLHPVDVVSCTVISVGN